MMKEETLKVSKIFFYLIFVSLTACATTADVYRDQNMDFGAIQAVAVMPFANLSRDTASSERVRDIFISKLLATGAVYVLPPGEVARGIARAEIPNPTAPSPEEVIKLGGLIKVQAVVTGVVREYGEVRSSTTSANVISMSLQIIETQTGKVVWTASSTKGGISIWDRLFGGGGQPMNDITEEAVDDVINKLFK
jgi:polysaccharide biosynthesis protein PelC